MEWYMMEEILLGCLNVIQSDVLAVIMPPALRETNICLILELAYQCFWGQIRTALWKDGRDSPLHGFDIIMLFRGELRVLTISFKTMNILKENIRAVVAAELYHPAVAAKVNQQLGLLAGRIQGRHHAL